MEDRIPWHPTILAPVQPIYQNVSYSVSDYAGQDFVVIVQERDGFLVCLDGGYFRFRNTHYNPSFLLFRNSALHEHLIELCQYVAFQVSPGHIEEFDKYAVSPGPFFPSTFIQSYLQFFYFDGVSRASFAAAPPPYVLHTPDPPGWAHIYAAGGP